jgi:hypothetical protein
VIQVYLLVVETELALVTIEALPFWSGMSVHMGFSVLVFLLFERKTTPGTCRDVMSLLLRLGVLLDRGILSSGGGTPASRFTGCMLEPDVCIARAPSHKKETIRAIGQSRQ